MPRFPKALGRRGHHLGRRTPLRLLLGCLLVLLASSAATIVFVEEQLLGIAGSLGHHKGLGLGNGQLADSGFGGPQTLLLVGNDQRKHTTTTPVLPHSNEMLLVRFDPGKPWISMMSIPRELYVPIDQPDGQVVRTRFNYAYTAGGMPLLVHTIKRVLGLPVNHVVVIDFNQFKQAVDEMGCVYTTVDRRYYHVNSPGGEQYQEINLQPGYQRMCGSDALQYVSYRHGDTSLVRDARDQSFLLAAKQQYGPTLIDNESKFENIFGSLVQTDDALHTPTGVLNLIGTLIGSAGLPVRQVHFKVDLTPSDPGAIACACVTATSAQIAASVHSFLYGVAHRPAPVAASTVAQARTLARHAQAAGSSTVPTLHTTSAADLAIARHEASRLPFPLVFPAVRDVVGPPTEPYVRNYEIHGPGGGIFPAFTEVFDTGVLGQYYDVQGTTWTNAPLFDNPSQTISVGGRRLELFYAGAHLVTVAWRTAHAIYWVHNSLLDAVDNAKMLAIAEQTSPVGVTPAAPRPIVLHAAPAPVYVAPGAKVSSWTAVGSAAGLVTLLLLIPFGAWSVMKRRRRLRVLRSAIDFNEQRAARLEAALSRSEPSRSTSPAPVPGRRSRAA